MQTQVRQKGIGTSYKKVGLQTFFELPIPLYKFFFSIVIHLRGPTCRSFFNIIINFFLLFFFRRRSLVQQGEEPSKTQELELIVDSLKDEVVKLKSANAILKRKSDSFLTKGLASDQAQVYFLQKEIEDLKEQLEKCPKKFCFDKIAPNDELVSHFTGLPNAAVFDIIVDLFDGMEIKYYLGWSPKNISVPDQIFITLLKLRRNLSNVDLAERFDVSVTTIVNIVSTWVDALHCVLIGKENCLLSKIPSRFKNSINMPKCFEKYPNTRIILDCTDVPTARPGLLSKNNKMFSTYKNRVTGKGLVGIAPDGTVTFVSPLYPGRTSDKDIVNP